MWNPIDNVCLVGSTCHNHMHRPRQVRQPVVVTDWTKSSWIPPVLHINIYPLRHSFYPPQSTFRALLVLSIKQTAFTRCWVLKVARCRWLPWITSPWSADQWRDHLTFTRMCSASSPSGGRDPSILLVPGKFCLLTWSTATTFHSSAWRIHGILSPLSINRFSLCSSDAQVVQLRNRHPLIAIWRPREDAEEEGD